jgi:hypothetical protein
MKNTFLAILIGLIAINVKLYSQSTVLREVRTVTKFDALVVSGLPEVYISEGQSDNVEMEVSGMPVDDVIISSADGVLTIKTRGEHNGESVKVYVTCSALRSIEVSGAAKLFSKNIIKSKNLNVYVRDAGEVVIDVDVNAVTVDLKDAGDLKISGTAHSRKVVGVGDNGTLNDNGLEVAMQ